MFIVKSDEQIQIKSFKTEKIKPAQLHNRRNC